MKPESIEALDLAREPSSKDTQALVKAAVVAVDPFDNSIPQGTFPTGVNFLVSSAGTWLAQLRSCAADLVGRPCLVRQPSNAYLRSNWLLINRSSIRFLMEGMNSKL